MAANANWRPAGFMPMGYIGQNGKFTGNQTGHRRKGTLRQIARSGDAAQQGTLNKREQRMLKRMGVKVKRPAAGGPPAPGLGAPAGEVSIMPVSDYPSTPAAMTAQEEALLADMRARADADMKDAEARKTAGEQQVNSWLGTQTGSINWQGADNRRRIGMDLGAQGAGWNPAFIAPAMRIAKREQVKSQQDVETQAAERLAALAEMLSQARRSHSAALSDIERQRAASGADLARLIRGVR